MEKQTKERMTKLEGKIHKTTDKDRQNLATQIATREKLERDYKEDFLHVSFNSSPETRRTILARKPNQKEFLTILSLSIEASRFEGKVDSKSIESMNNIYSNLHKLATNLCVDKKLDEKFWSECVSFETLQNFISELILASQKGTGVQEKELKSFR